MRGLRAQAAGLSVCALVVGALLFLPALAAAQVSAPNAAGVAMGHLHYHVKDVAANKRFWIALGGTPIDVGGTDVVKFPDVLVALTQKDSSGGTEGSVLNHVAFRVPSFASVEAAGLKVDRLAGFPGVGNTRTPEGERIELFEDAATNLTFTPDAGQSGPGIDRHNKPVGKPVAFHHLHLYVPKGAVGEAKAWYARMFGGVIGKRSTYDAVDLPGVNFNFSDDRGPGAPMNDGSVGRRHRVDRRTESTLSPTSTAESFASGHGESRLATNATPNRVLGGNCVDKD
jgi:hypothetical protein